MAEYKKPKWMKRFRTSDAYIDSFLVVIFVALAAALATWIAYETRMVINPWWLGISIITILIYVMLILWLLNQFHDINRIFATYMTGILCLGMIVSFVAYVSGVSLPTDLPILNMYAYLLNIQLESFDPGSVAISYAVTVGLLAWLISLPFVLLDDTRIVRSIVKVLRLDQLDYIVDSTLDHFGYWIDTGKYGWMAVLIGLLVAVSVIVVGGAALI